MNIQMAAFAFGCLLLFVAILGGGFELKELKVPKVGRASRLASCLFGMLFVIIGFGPAVADVLPENLVTVKPPAPAPEPQKTVIETDARLASLSTRAPQPDLRSTIEPARQPRVRRAAGPGKPQPTTEAKKLSLRKKAQKKVKEAWRRVW